MNGKNQETVIKSYFFGDYLMYQESKEVIIMSSEDIYQKTIKTFNVPEEIILMASYQMSNILLYVSIDSPNLVKIFLIDKYKIVGEICFPSNIINIKLYLNNLSLVVVLDTNILHILCFPDFQFQSKSFKIDRGIFDIRETEKDLVLLYSGDCIGVITIKNVESQTEETTKVHKSNISIIALNKEATYFASGSVYGTYIKIFNINEKALLMKIRRGKNYADIHYLCFTNDSKYIISLCKSSEIKLQVFEINKDNTKSGIFSYFKGEKKHEIKVENIDTPFFASNSNVLFIFEFKKKLVKYYQLPDLQIIKGFKYLNSLNMGINSSQTKMEN